jgi:ribosome-associated protein
MNTQELLVIVVDALEDIKAQNMQVFDTTPLTSLFERVIICNGTSNRQTRSLASHVREKVKEAGEEVLSVEGEESGEWVLVDMGSIVVHIMQPMIRDYYRLEELWGAHPITVEKPVKAKPAAKKVAVKRAPAKKAAVSSDDAAPAPAKKTVARKIPAKKAV